MMTGRSKSRRDGRLGDDLLTDMEMGSITWINYNEAIRQAALTREILKVKFPEKQKKWTDQEINNEWAANIILGQADSDAERIITQDIQQRLAAGFIQNTRSVRAFPEVDVSDITKEVAEIAIAMNFVTINQIPHLRDHAPISYEAWVGSNESRSALQPAEMPSAKKPSRAGNLKAPIIIDDDSDDQISMDAIESVPQASPSQRAKTPTRSEKHKAPISIDDSDGNSSHSGGNSPRQIFEGAITSAPTPTSSQRDASMKSWPALDPQDIPGSPEILENEVAAGTKLGTGKAPTPLKRTKEPLDFLSRSKMHAVSAQMRKVVADQRAYDIKHYGKSELPKPKETGRLVKRHEERSDSFDFNPDEARAMAAKIREVVAGLKKGMAEVEKGLKATAPVKNGKKAQDIINLDSDESGDDPLLMEVRPRKHPRADAMSPSGQTSSSDQEPSSKRPKRECPPVGHGSYDELVAVTFRPRSPGSDQKSWKSWPSIPSSHYPEGYPGKSRPNDDPDDDHIPDRNFASFVQRMNASRAARVAARAQGGNNPAAALPPTPAERRASPEASPMSIPSGNDSQLRAVMKALVVDLLKAECPVETIVELVRPLFPMLEVEDWEETVIQIENEMVMEARMANME